MRALPKLRGAWCVLTLSMLLLSAGARSVQAGAKSLGPSDLTLAAGNPSGSAGLVRGPWLSGSVQALQASLGSDNFWENSNGIEPPTGRRDRRIGTALLALGLLRTATSVMHVIFGAPSRCGPGKGLDWSEDSCSNLRLYGYLGMGLSAAFLAGGSIELGRGLMLKRRHDEWKKTHWDHFSSHMIRRGPTVQVAQLSPWLR